jgi:Zn-dependent protease with chaperone function
MPLPPSVLADPLWAHLAAHWKPIPKRPGYVVGLIVSALAIVLLPLLYLAFMASIGLGALWLLLHRAAHGRGGGGSAIEGLLVVIVCIVAPFVIIFMLKPLFAPGEREGKAIQLKQFEELRLHSFVENVCAILGAPAPKRIDIDCDVNASAGFRGGLLGVIFQRDPTLTIGLPLVAGMTRSQFAGVLAHEFGHFSQGTGMRVSRAARAVVAWIHRAAFERDAWDAHLRALSYSPDGWVQVFAMLVRFGVFLSRLVIFPIAMLGLGMWAYTLRRMENDADLHQMQFCGSASFEQAFVNIEELGYAWQRALAEALDSFGRNRQLPEDFPACVATYARRLTPEQRDEIAATRDREETSFFDTHPSTKSRIAHARALNIQGLYTDDSPARGLFQDFEAACRKATRGEFRAALGPYAIEAKFVPVGHELAASDKHAARVAILPRYLGYDPPTWRPVFPALRSISTVDDPKPIAQRLRASRHELRDKARAARAKSEQYRKAAEELLKWEHVRAVLDAKLRVDFTALKLPSTTREGVSTRIESLTNEIAAAADIIDDAGDMAMHRLSAALGMLGVPAIDRAVPDAAKLRHRASQLLPAAATLREVLPLASHIRRLSGTADVVILGVKNQQTFEASKKVLRPISDEIRNRLDDVRRITGGVPDPFAPDDNNTNMGESLVGATPSWRDIEEILGAGKLFVARYADCYRRVLGELVEIGETMEKALAASARAQVVSEESSGAGPAR